MLNPCEISEPKYDIAGISPKLRLSQSSIHGFGVFSNDLIKQGELIEEARLLALKWRSFYLSEPTMLDYIWANQSCKCEVCNTHGNKVYLALGNGSLYNHANKPNTIQKLDFRLETLTIIARNDIPANEEIFVSYGENYWLYRNLMKKISPLKYK